MSDPVLIALIGGGLAFVQAVTLAILGFVFSRLGKVRKDAAATRDHVVNDHDTNFREENDTRHAETLRLFGEVRKDIGGLRGDIRGIGERVSTLEKLELTDPQRRRYRK